MLLNCVYWRNTGRTATLDSDCFNHHYVCVNRHAKQDKRAREKQQTLNFTLMEILNNIFSDFNEIFSAGRTMPEMEEMKRQADEFVEQSKKIIENEKKRQNICECNK